MHKAKNWHLYYVRVKGRATCIFFKKLHFTTSKNKIGHLCFEFPSANNSINVCGAHLMIPFFLFLLGETAQVSVYVRVKLQELTPQPQRVAKLPKQVICYPPRTGQVAASHVRGSRLAPRIRSSPASIPICVCITMHRNLVSPQRLKYPLHQNLVPPQRIKVSPQRLKYPLHRNLVPLRGIKYPLPPFSFSS
jgi:hypothetical protein